MEQQQEPIDVVYTWVDDRFPGYRELLNQYAGSRHDLNPNRTRDNLDLLKYSLRSLERFLPWVRHIYLVTCRPQVPAWLDRDAARLTVIHHDQFFDPDDLPTFNSFAILTNLHRIPGLSRRFLQVEDDYLFGRDVRLADFAVEGGRLRFWPKVERSQGAHLRERAGASPWQLALAYSNYLLDSRYGREPRWIIKHAPMMIDVDLWHAMIAQWPEDFRRTSASRFRTMYNVAPEHLYPYYLVYESKAEIVPLARSYAVAHYQGVDNILPQQYLQFAFLHWLRPKFFCLNDNFGHRPSPRVVRLTRRFLERHYPRPSRFERVSQPAAPILRIR